MAKNSGCVSAAIPFYFLLLLSSVCNAQVSIITQPLDDTVCLTQSTTASFTCVVDRGGVEIFNAGWNILIGSEYRSVVGRPGHMVNPSINNDIITDTLTVTNVSVNNNNAQYRCEPEASNVTTMTVTLTVLDPPLIVDLTDTTCTNDFTVSWTATSNEGVSYDMTVSPSNVNITQLMETSYNFTGVMMPTTYVVSIFSRIDQSTCVGIPSNVTGTTLTVEAGVPERVESLRNITVTNTTIKVVWNDAVSPNGCGTVFYYIAIAVNLMDRSDMMTMEPRDNVTEFSNLINGTSYEISVFAINRVGNGTSSMINVTTLHDNEGSGGNGSAMGVSANDDDPPTVIIIVICVVVIIVIIITTIIIILVVYRIKRKKWPCTNKDSKASDMQELKSPTSTSEGHKVGKASVQPSNVPHQTAASGEEYAVTTKVAPRSQQQQQQPTQEYAVVDKSKKHSATTQGITYADLQALPSSGNVPSQNQGPTSTYAMVA